MMPDADTIGEFFKTTAMHGLGWTAVAAFVGLSLWFLYRVVRIIVSVLESAREYTPKVASSYVSLMDTLRDNSDTQTAATTKTANALDTLSKSRSDDDARTHRALKHLTIAAQKATSDQEVHRHLEEAKRELSGA